MRVARPVLLGSGQRQILGSPARARSASARSVERARIVLLAAAGLQDKQIAAKLRSESDFPIPTLYRLRE